MVASFVKSLKPVLRLSASGALRRKLTPSGSPDSRTSQSLSSAPSDALRASAPTISKKRGVFQPHKFRTAEERQGEQRLAGCWSALIAASTLSTAPSIISRPNTSASGASSFASSMAAFLTAASSEPVTKWIQKLSSLPKPSDDRSFAASSSARILLGLSLVRPSQFLNRS